MNLKKKKILSNLIHPTSCSQNPSTAPGRPASLRHEDLRDHRESHHHSRPLRHARLHRRVEVSGPEGPAGLLVHGGAPPAAGLRGHRLHLRQERRRDEVVSVLKSMSAVLAALVFVDSLTRSSIFPRGFSLAPFHDFPYQSLFFFSFCRFTFCFVILSFSFLLFFLSYPLFSVAFIMLLLFFICSLMTQSFLLLSILSLVIPFLYWSPFFLLLYFLSGLHFFPYSLSLSHVHKSLHCSLFSLCSECSLLLFIIYLLLCFINLRSYLAMLFLKLCTENSDYTYFML